jgi:hypothetical protein
MGRRPLTMVLISAGIGMAVGLGILTRPKAPDHVTESPVSKFADTIAQGGGGGGAPIGTPAKSEPPIVRGIEQAPSIPKTAKDAAPMTALSVESLSVDQLLSETAHPMTSMGGLSFGRLRELARSDPAVVRDLISRFEAQTDAETKDALRAVLSGLPLPEVVEFSQRLALGNAAQRKDAYELLGSLADSGQAQGAILRALDTEQDPALLTQAVRALRPTIVEPAQTQAMIAKLSGLTQDADPLVRGASLQALAQWDKTGGVAEPSVYQALVDPQPEIRAAAISAAMYNNQLNSERLKAALIDILSNTDEADDKTMVLQALERFQLTDAEYVIYSQAKLKDARGG